MKFKRDAIFLGIESAQLLLEYINNPLLFENRRVKIRYDRKIFDTIPTYVSPNSECKINLLLLNCPTTDALLKVIPNFERNYRIKVDYKVYSYLNLYNKIIEQHSENDFDIFVIDLPWINSFTKQNYLYCLND